MKQLFGHFIEQPATGSEYLRLGFSPTSVPLKQRWRNNGLSADFLGDYVANFFPATDKNEQNFVYQQELRSAVSYIANELLENAMKYNNEKVECSINIHLLLLEGRLIFYVTNSISSQLTVKFQNFIQELLQEEPEDLYLRRLQANASDAKTGNMNQSGLGLLTILNDYNTQLGWKFENLPRHPDLIVVTTMVQLNLSNND
jgi:hypothetical protein